MHGGKQAGLVNIVFESHGQEQGSVLEASQAKANNKSMANKIALLCGASCV